MGYSRAIRPSDYGPTFIFETKTSIMDEYLYKKLFSETFLQYQVSNYLDLNWKQLIEYRNASYRIILNPYENLNIQKELNGAITFHSPLDQKLNPNNLAIGLENDNKHYYIVIDTFKNNDLRRPLNIQEESSLQKIFHDFIKYWIKELEPNFVYGDQFPLIYKERFIDSRSHIWGVNYFSKDLLDKIGLEKFHSLDDAFWSVEKLGQGLLLIGKPDPYNMKKSPKSKAEKVLSLKESLKEILQDKEYLKIEIESKPRLKGYVDI